MHINFQNIKTGSFLFIYRHRFFLSPKADTVNTMVRYRKMFYGSTVPCLKETDFISKERIVFYILLKTFWKNIPSMLMFCSFSDWLSVDTPNPFLFLMKPATFLHSIKGQIPLENMHHTLLTLEEAVRHALLLWLMLRFDSSGTRVFWSPFESKLISSTFCCSIIISHSGPFQSVFFDHKNILSDFSLACSSIYV